MKKDIIPSFSVLVSEEVFLTDETLRGLQHIYVQSENMQLFHYAKTSGGYSFHSLGSIKGLPKKIEALPSKLIPTFSHLPGGKIPIGLLSQILSFFMDYALKGSDEAIAHILWNTLTSEYEVGVPTQKVSAAAANFVYDDIKPHHVIVVDIHSHNYMSSFWSGTDDKDDAKGVWLSGVFGNVGTNPSCSWRYSYLGNFIETNHDEIFDSPFDTVNLLEEYPKEWNDKVTVRPTMPPLLGNRHPYGSYGRDLGLEYDEPPGWARNIPGYYNGEWDDGVEFEWEINAQRTTSATELSDADQDHLYDVADEIWEDLRDMSSVLTNRLCLDALSEVGTDEDLKYLDKLVTNLYALRAKVHRERKRGIATKILLSVPRPSDVGYKGK